MASVLWFWKCNLRMLLLHFGILFLCKLVLQMSLHKHASSHCSLLWYANAYVLSYIISIPGMMCVIVPFSKLHEYAYLYCFSCGTKVCLRTNYGGGIYASALFTNKLWQQCTLSKHCCHIDSILVPYVVCVSVPYMLPMSYMNILIVLVVVRKYIVYQHLNYGNHIYCEIFGILLYQICVYHSSIVNYMNAHVFCCGTKSTLFTNKLPNILVLNY